MRKGIWILALVFGLMIAPAVGATSATQSPINVVFTTNNVAPDKIMVTINILANEKISGTGKIEIFIPSGLIATDTQGFSIEGNYLTADINTYNATMGSIIFTGNFILTVREKSVNTYTIPVTVLFNGKKITSNINIVLQNNTYTATVSKDPTSTDRTVIFGLTFPELLVIALVAIGGLTLLIVAIKS